MTKGVTVHLVWQDQQTFQLMVSDSGWVIHSRPNHEKRPFFLTDFHQKLSRVEHEYVHLIPCRSVPSLFRNHSKSHVQLFSAQEHKPWGLQSQWDSFSGNHECQHNMSSVRNTHGGVAGELVLSQRFVWHESAERLPLHIVHGSSFFTDCLQISASMKSSLDISLCLPEGHSAMPLMCMMKL